MSTMYLSILHMKNISCKEVSPVTQNQILNVCENEGYKQYVKMIGILCKQTEYKQFIGSFWIFILYKMKWPLYHFWRKHFIVKTITVEKDDMVLGGFELSQTGEFGSAVLTTDFTYRVSVIKILFNLGELLLQDKTTTFIVRTFNPVIVSTLKKRGFHEVSERKLYVITVPLGPFTLTWNNKNLPKWGKSFLNINELIYLTRPASIQDK